MHAVELPKGGFVVLYQAQLLIQVDGSTFKFVGIFPFSHAPVISVARRVQTALQPLFLGRRWV